MILILLCIVLGKFALHIYKFLDIDLRQRIRDNSRWNEICSSVRRLSDDEESGNLSPYSDLDDPKAANDPPSAKKSRPIRMRMRADDVKQRKSTIQRKDDRSTRMYKYIFI